MNLRSYSRHAESSGVVPASPERVFAYIDDPTRVLAHVTQSSWRLAGSQLEEEIDLGRGQIVGSHVRLSGHIAGQDLSVETQVVEREVPSRKAWETLGEPHLLLIANYRVTVEIASAGSDSRLRVAMDYDLPESSPVRALARMLGDSYARWHTRMVLENVQRHFEQER